MADPLADPQQELLREGGVHELELPFNRVGLLGRKLEQRDEDGHDVEESDAKASIVVTLA